MSVSLLLEMAASSNPDRTAIVSEGASGSLRLTTQQLSDLADGGAGVIAGSGAQHVVYIGTGGAMLPVLIFASARAGMAFTPLNYRLSADGLRALIDRLPEPLVIVDARYRDAVGDASGRVLESGEFLEAARSAEPAVDGPRSPTRTPWRSCCSPRAPRRSPKPSSCPTTTSPATSPAQSNSSRPARKTPR